MTVPDFLIIGGMKCGSTTLYRDLMTNPRVFFPIDKEPESFCHDEVLTDVGRARYAAMFDGARTDQICAEASTAYTKRPDFDGIAERAKAVCGRDLRVIYLVRDPVKRAISHHYHEFSRGNMPRSIDDAVKSHPALVNYSMYAMQVEPWIDTFGPEQVKIVRFEEYIKDRRGVCSQLCAFLGIEPKPELIDADKVFNQSETKRIMRGPAGFVGRSRLYRRFVRPMMSVGLKDRIRTVFLPKAPPRPEPPTPETEAWLREQFASDQARLHALMDPKVKQPL